VLCSTALGERKTTGFFVSETGSDLFTGDLSTVIPYLATLSNLSFLPGASAPPFLDTL
jgi:hypothetical protein